MQIATHRSLRSLLALFLGLSLTLTPSSLARASSKLALDDPQIDHAKMAETLLRRHSLEGAIASTFDFPNFLKGEFVRLRLGLFDLHMESSSVSDKQTGDEFREVAEAILGLQEAWLNCTQPVSKDQTQARKDLAALQAYVKGLRGAGIQKAVKKEGPGDLYALMGARDSTREAAESFASFMTTAACLGLERAVDRETLVIVPERQRYIEFVSLAGWLRPELQGQFWIPSIARWTNCYIDEYRFMALRLPAMDGSKEGHLKGLSMNERTANGLQQQLAQLAALSLIDNYYGGKVPPALAGGLSVMLTVDQFGECNTKVDGDLRERRTEAYEVFVPGGLSEGGILPPNYADSRWRKKQGSEYFKGVLRQAQKAGAKDAKRLKGKYRHFELENDDKNKRTLASGPFMGPDATDLSKMPDMYAGDRDEFLRAYRTGFLHFLRTASMGKPKVSAPYFARWLQALASPEEGEDLLATTKRIFDGAALTDAEPSKESLEGRFLIWLGK